MSDNKSINKYTVKECIANINKLNNSLETEKDVKQRFEIRSKLNVINNRLSDLEPEEER